MKRLRLTLILLALLPALPSCAGKKENVARSSAAPQAAQAPKLSFLQQCLAKIPLPFKNKKKTPTALPPQWTGVIRMVNTSEHFVLIEANAAASAVPGETYLSVAKGVETASLRMTALKNPPFLIADVLSGNPAPGEKIYRPRPASDPAPTPAASKPSPPKKQQPPHRSVDKSFRGINYQPP